jgi:hypothetical protein
MKGRDAFTHLHTGIPFQLLPLYMGLNFEIVGVGPTNSQFISCRNPKHILTKPRTFNTSNTEFTIPSINYSQLDTPVVFKKIIIQFCGPEIISDLPLVHPEMQE